MLHQLHTLLSRGGRMHSRSVLMKEFQENLSYVFDVPAGSTGKIVSLWGAPWVGIILPKTLEGLGQPRAVYSGV